MDLDYHQTRRLFLAGTVSFPRPFPSVAALTITKGNLAFAPVDHTEPKQLVVVHEEPGPEQATKYVILAEHVSAIFFYAGKGNYVEDFENGAWVLGPTICSDKLWEELRADIKRRHIEKRGIVFVPKHRPVLTIREFTQLAGAVDISQSMQLTACDHP